MDSRVASTCLLLVLAGCGGSAPRFPGKSLILISIDTLRADALGVYGERKPTSPALDRLAAESILFRRAISPSCVTAPSHMSLLTGLYPTVHLVDNWSFLTTEEGRSKVARRRLGREVATLASVLGEKGYATAAFVGGGNVSHEMGFDQGFDLYDDGADNGMNGNREQLFDPTRSLEWLSAHRGEKLFAFLHTYIPHGPYLPPPPWDTAFTDPSYAGQIPGDRREFYAERGKTYQERTVEYWAKVKPDERDVAHLHDLYRGDVRYADDALARILDGLRESGILDACVLVLVSDHGEEFLEHGSFEHQKKLYEELVHVPLLIRLPGGHRGGTVIDDAVPLLSVMPTVLELLAVDPPRQVMEESLVPLLGDGPAPAAVISEKVLEWSAEPASSGDPLFRPTGILRAVRWGSWTYIRRTGSDASEELYDRATDPLEARNQARNPARSAILDELRSLLAAHESRCSERAATLGQAETATLSARTLEELEALGYLRGDE